MTTSIKANYKAIYDLLVANSNKQVKTILPQIQELMTTKVRSANSFTSADGTLWVYCYYHKKWENTTVVEYRPKSSNKTTGLNTMCHEGQLQWSKQDRDYKKAKEEALNMLTSGTLDPANLESYLVTLAEEKALITPRQDEHGFDEVPE